MPKPLPAVLNGVKLVRAPDASYAVDVPPLIRRIATVGGLEIAFKQAPRIFEKHQRETVNLAKPRRRRVTGSRATYEGRMKLGRAQAAARKRENPPHPQSLRSIGLGDEKALRAFLRLCTDETVLTDLLMRELTTDCRYAHVFRIFLRLQDLRNHRENRKLWALFDEFKASQLANPEYRGHGGGKTWSKLERYEKYYKARGLKARYY